MTARVKCDKCGWSQETPTLRDTLQWHGLQCPRCHDSVIVNDDDAEILKALLELQEGGLIKVLDPGEEAALTVKLDTGPMRKAR